MLSNLGRESIDSRSETCLFVVMTHNHYHLLYSVIFSQLCRPEASNRFSLLVEEALKATAHNLAVTLRGGLPPPHSYIAASS